MKKSYCDKCKEEMVTEHLRILDTFNHNTYEVCGKCCAKILNFLGVESGSNMVKALQKFPDNKDMEA